MKGRLPKNIKIGFPKRGEGIPALSLRFASLDELFSEKGHRAMKQVFEESEKAFNELRERPESLVLPPSYAPSARKQFEKLLRERTTQGFGVNWSIRGSQKGAELRIIPRATAISLQDAKKRIAGLEFFANAQLQRSELGPGEQRTWAGRERDFKYIVKKALS